LSTKNQVQDNSATKASPAKSKQTSKPVPATPQTGGLLLADTQTDGLDLADAPSVSGQAERLNNLGLQAVQRQKLAGQIGTMQGNGHMQQVLAFARTNQKTTAPLKPNNKVAKAPTVSRKSSKKSAEPLKPKSDTQTSESRPDEQTEALGAEEFAALWGNDLPESTETADSTTASQSLPQTVQRREAASVKTDAPAPPTPEEKAEANANAETAMAKAEQDVNQALAQGSQARAAGEGERANAQVAQQAVVEAKAAANTGPAPVPAIETAADAPQPQPDNAAVEAPAGEKSESANSAPTSAQDDPAFQSTVANVKGVAKNQADHAPSSAKAKEAQAAAVSPASELAGKAEANQVDEMDGAETPGFDAKAFKAKLMARIKELTPKTAEAADEFKENNVAGQLKSNMQSETAAQKEKSQAPLDKATAAAPDAGSVTPKPTKPLAPNAAGPAPGDVGAAGAAPKSKGQGQVEAPIAATGPKLDQQMAAANITDEQLANSNEPEMVATLSAKKDAKAQAATAPQAYRQQEKAIIAQAEQGAVATAKAETTAIHQSRVGALGQVDAQQAQGKGKDEAARAEIGTELQNIYKGTKSKVESILSTLDGEVDAAFQEGAEAAKQSFESHVDNAMDAYKEKRYAGIIGKMKWLKDKFTPTRQEVLDIFNQGRQHYIQAMDGVINHVTALIGRKLSEAKAEIAKGKQAITAHVNNLPANLQSVGQAAAQDIQGQFTQLEQDVESKQSGLIDRLASQYNEKLQAVDQRLDEMKAANATFYDMAADKIVGTVQTILNLKNMLLGVLAKAAAAVDSIIKDPIGFLGNLVSGVKQGLDRFVNNIGTHLKKGFIGWLTGALTGAGISLPDKWDLPGIFQLVMQVMGVSFQSIMGRLSGIFGFDIMGVFEPVKQVIEIYQSDGLGGLAKAGLTRIVGEEHMQSLLEVWQMVQGAISGNWNMLWGLLQGHLTNLKEMVFGKIEEFLTESVIKSGVTWIVSMLNPAGAFIKACKAIYDIVMFFVNRGSQVMSLVNSVIGSISAIASGNLSAAAGAVEDALAKSIPVAIGFLGSLLGLGNVSGKVQEIIQSVRGLVDQGLNAVFNSKPVQMVVGFIKKLVGKIKGGLGLDNEPEGSEIQTTSLDPPSGTGSEWKLATLEAGTTLYSAGAASKSDAKWGSSQKPDLMTYVIDNQWSPEWGAERPNKFNSKDGTTGTDYSRTPIIEYAISVSSDIVVYKGLVSPQEEAGVSINSTKQEQYYHSDGLGEIKRVGILGYVPRKATPEN